MPNVLHRITKDYRISVSPNEIDPSEWLIEPNISSVEDLPCYYWIIDNDVVRRPTDEERRQIDMEQGFISGE